MKKNKLHLTLTLLFSIGFVLPILAQGIKFQKGSWEEIKAISKMQHKPIFIDFGAVWCVPCRYLSQNIFPEKAAGDFYNKNFICIQVDVEKGEGIMLADKYNVGGLPTLIFTNPREKVIYRITGAMNVSELINKGKIALTHQEDSSELKAKYLKNELNQKDLYRYLLIVKMKGNRNELNKVLDNYVTRYPDVNMDMFNTIIDNVNTINTKAFNFLEKHRNEFATLVGKDTVKDFIRKMYIKNVGFKNYDDELDYKAAIAQLDYKIHLTEEEELNISTDYYYKIKDKKGYLAAASQLAKKYDQKNSEALSLLIGGTSAFHLTKDDLLMVKSWAERALSLKNNAVNALSLAIIYKNLKNKKLALKYIDLALQNSIRDKDHEEVHIEAFKKQIENAEY